MADKPSSARPGPQDRREGILKIAAEVFQETGYAAASMSMIAARVGGSKGTLYNYFKSKEALFEAHVQAQCGSIWDALLDWPDDTRDIAETLQTIGEHYLTNIMSERMVANFRLLIAESQRTPDLGRVFYEAGPARGFKRMSQVLEAAVARGQLKALDSYEAGRQFLGLCRNSIWMERLLNLMPEPTADDAAALTRRAVTLFMAAYGR